MSKRTGVSAEEKLSRMINFFHSSNSFYTIKDLQKLVPKATGIVSQSVEDTVKSLVDDGLVKLEKVGSVNLYWSFTSEQAVSINRAIKKQDQELQILKASVLNLERTVELESVDREDTLERQIGLQDILQLQTIIKALQEELEKCTVMNSERIEEKVKLCELYKSGAENWTDNLSTLAKHCLDQFMMDHSTFCREFGLEVDFEDLVW
ncbi:hypothetical protein CROQUDRAFT_656324 [Cronartium quercuum f. sp. fusiforme G11]|uniref:Meiotic nuclear division protein 1 n=1 Tax=Cronartium quercuum f. sp. fusiforme G11 TaxID=708437 RepID=A0A9P6TD11_9BASI|nr:hypothetical protein CROQUDRAFT_656324 [Cronartium quercuum f. sp. fusiforme G11]